MAQLADASPASPDVTPGSGWSAVATDVRGPFTLVVFQNGSSGATCLTGPSVTVVSQTTADGRFMSVSGGVSLSGHRRGVDSVGSSSVLGSGSSGSISHVTLAHLASTSQGAYSLVDGQVDEGVTGVTLVLSDGEHVHATTGNGWFVAWWPGKLDATSAAITSASGTSEQPLTGAGHASKSKSHASGRKRVGR
jgi:hypothetical protein